MCVLYTIAKLIGELGTFLGWPGKGFGSAKSMALKQVKMVSSP